MSGRISTAVDTVVGHRGNARLWVAAGIAVVALTAGSGCGRSDMGRVSGVVTYRSKPVADAVVTFRPQNRPVATGRTDAAGRYRLSTYTAGDGAVRGENRVAITPWIPGPNLFPEPGQPPPPWVDPKRDDIPEKFRQEATSGLTVEVVSRKQNEFSFELGE
jgi:hypothetical protein